MKEYTFEKSYQMFEQARQYIPNGIYGPRTPAFLTFGSYPCFLSQGKGSHIWDVDGNEYIDYMCSFGTNIIGLCNDEVDGAAREQMSRGNAFTLPSDRWNEMAEYMINLISGADWLVFAKNGSDVTTYATTVARAYAGKNKIIVSKGAYHGSHFWSMPGSIGVPADYYAHTLYFEYNNLDDLKRVIAENKGDVAGIMLTPYQHAGMGDQIMPVEGFYSELRKICDQENIVLIMDDIRCGFRLNLHGSHCYFGADPDLICFGKAMGNGYPISVMTGKEKLKNAAESTYFTGTHFFSAVPMAASLACMKIIERDGVIEHCSEMGKLMKNGMEQQAAAFNLKVSYTGHPAMPYMRFVGDDDFSINRFFCGEAAKRGVFLHPHHNWFISGAHTKADIEQTLTVTEECFKLTVDKYFK